MYTKEQWNQLGDTARELTLTMYDRAVAQGITDLVVLDAAMLMQATANIFNLHQRHEAHEGADPVLVGIINNTARAIEDLANSMPAPNKYTPRFMSLAISVRQAVFDALEIRQNRPTAYGAVPGPPVNPDLGSVT